MLYGAVTTRPDFSKAMTALGKFILNLEVSGGDIDGAFLNAELEEDI